MSCSTTDTTTCCCTENPCYDDTGCLHPTTFECISAPGTLEDINVTNDMNGKEVLQAINDVIKNLEIPTPEPGADKFVKATSADTTADYLNSKISVGQFLSKSIVTPGGNEKVKIDADLAEMISADTNNQLEIGTDNKLRVIQEAAENITYLLEGSGITVTGDGSVGNPYVVSTNPSIQIVRNCFDGIWRNITLVSTGNANVIYVSGNPQYRIRYDGTVEFKGSATYTVNFGAYTNSARKFTVNIATIPTSCLSAGEQAGVADLKSINYIDVPQIGADQITQQYGYIVRKSTQNIILEFQSSFLNSTTKTIVVNFEGCTSHPSL